MSNSIRLSLGLFSFQQSAVSKKEVRVYLPHTDGNRKVHSFHPPESRQPNCPDSEIRPIGELNAPPVSDFFLDLNSSMRL